LINLKRDNIIKDLLDVCLHNSNHYLIYENADLFTSIFDKVDPVMKKDLVVLENIVKNIAKGKIDVIE
jgi:hypothetical protein